MKLKKIVALLLSVVTVGSCLSFSACRKDDVIKDGKTVNIQISKSGYGEEYIREIATAFETAYAAEGYKINILEPDPNFGTTNALNAMRLSDASGYDIVFPGSVFIEDVVDHVEFGTIVEPLDDIYALPAIDFNGNDESKTLEQKLERLVSNESGKRTICTPDGKYWGFARVGSVRGVVTNTKALEANGLDFEDDYAYTTDQFVANMHTISAKGDMRPMIWGGDNAATYSVGTVLTSLRQIMTEEEYQEFSTFYGMYEKAGNKIPADGWKYRIYHDALQPTMEFLMETWDTNNAMEGSYSMRHDDAHGYLMLGDKAVYMFDGEYFYNEVRVNYPEYLDDIRMMNRPVSSYLGLRLDLCGTDHDVGYGKNVNAHCAKCDEILALGCKMYDEDKTATEIKTALQALNANITDGQVSEIMRARGVAYGGPASGYIMKCSDVKDIAKLFLRMLASDDAAEVYAKSGMLSAFSTAGLSDDVDEFVKDCFRIDRQWTSIGDTHGDPYAPASRMGFVLSPYSATIGKNVNDFMSDKDRDYGILAKDCLATIVETEHSKNWANWITTKASLAVGENMFEGYTGNEIPDVK